LFLQTPYNHVGIGQGCPKCSVDNSYSDTESFINKSKQIHGIKYDYSLVNYKNSKSKVDIICPIHGIFQQQPSGHLNGRGCHICKESKGEMGIRIFLENNNICFKLQKRFDGCVGKKYKLPFDFYLPDYNLLIEYDGIQHYDKTSKFYHKETIINDNIKTEYCIKYKIDLLRIPYYNIDAINNIIEEKLYILAKRIIK